MKQLQLCNIFTYYYILHYLWYKIISNFFSSRDFKNKVSKTDLRFLITHFVVFLFGL